MSLRSIYSLRVFCDGDSVGKTTSGLFGFYQDLLVPTNPVVIGWSESLLAQSSNGTTVIDGLLARSYAPIILNVSQITQNYDVDSPVVNNSGISVTIANHEKCLMYIKQQGIELIGLKVRLSINFYNESGVLTSTRYMFYGEIQSLQMNETSFVISCNNNKFIKESNLLNDGEILTVGTLIEQDQSHVKTIRNDNFKTTLSNSGQTSFLLIGGYDTINATERKRTYQIFFKTSIPIGLDITGYWMYVELSGTESKGEYRRITSCEEITYAEVDDSIADPAIGTYIGQYVPGYYLEVEIEGAFTEGLIVDLCTYVQFIQFNHSYALSKNALTGTVERLYNKSDDSVIAFGTYGYSCTLNTDGTIDLDVDYPIDDDTIATYSVLPCKSISLIGDNSGTITNETNLREWIYELGDSGSSDPFDKLNSQYCDDNNGGFVAGFYHGSSATVNIATSKFADDGGVFDRRIYYPYYSRFTNTYSVAGSAIVGIQFELPALLGILNFKSVHLGIAIKSTCTNGIATPTGITCITKQTYGTAKKHFTAPLVHSSGSAYINTIPGFYTLPTNTFENNFYPTDWQWKTPDTAPQTRFTSLELTKLQDVDTIEKYNKILKVGLFFPRDGGTNVSDDILLYEIAVIFKHENSLTEVFV